LLNTGNERLKIILGVLVGFLVALGILTLLTGPVDRLYGPLTWGLVGLAVAAVIFLMWRVKRGK
jgi:hypothetical protein